MQKNYPTTLCITCKKHIPLRGCIWEMRYEKEGDCTAYIQKVKK